MKVTVEHDGGNKDVFWLDTDGMLRVDLCDNREDSVLIVKGTLLQRAPKPSPRPRVADMDGRITRTETLLANCMEEIGALRARLHRVAPVRRKVEWRAHKHGSALWLFDADGRVAFVHHGHFSGEWFWCVDGGDERAEYEQDAREKAFRRAVEVHGPLELVR